VIPINVHDTLPLVWVLLASLCILRPYSLAMLQFLCCFSIKVGQTYWYPILCESIYQYTFCHLLWCCSRWRTPTRPTLRNELFRHSRQVVLASATSCFGIRGESIGSILFRLPLPLPATSAVVSDTSRRGVVSVFVLAVFFSSATATDGSFHIPAINYCAISSFSRLTSSSLSLSPSKGLIDVVARWIVTILDWWGSPSVALVFGFLTILGAAGQPSIIVPSHSPHIWRPGCYLFGRWIVTMLDRW
jgi:hypothetical protein